MHEDPGGLTVIKLELILLRLSWDFGRSELQQSIPGIPILAVSGIRG